MSDDHEDPFEVTTIKAPAGWYVPAGTPKGALRWRLRPGPRGNDSAFDEAFIRRLSQEYSIDVEAITYLSAQVADILSEEIAFLDVENISDREAKGQRQAAEAGKLIASAIRDLRQAQKQMENLHFTDLIARSDRGPVHEKPSDMCQSAIAQTEALDNMLVEVREEGRVVYGLKPDQRRDRDPRRTHMCNTIFQFWHEQGRSVSYTSNPVSNQREGPLVRFTNEIIEHVTEPSTRLKGETVRSEIKSFRKSKIIPSS